MELSTEIMNNYWANFFFNYVDYKISCTLLFLDHNSTQNKNPMKASKFFFVEIINPDEKSV